MSKLGQGALHSSKGYRIHFLNHELGNELKTILWYVSLRIRIYLTNALIKNVHS